jgi:hypothetical protein
MPPAAFVYVIPIGMIQAITNQQVGLNVITELIIGYALPGHPVAMMMFKTWYANLLYAPVEIIHTFIGATSQWRKARNTHSSDIFLCIDETVSLELHFRLQAGPLYEGTSPAYVLESGETIFPVEETLVDAATSGCCNGGRWNGAIGSSSVDVYEYRVRDLHLQL